MSQAPPEFQRPRAEYAEYMDAHIIAILRLLYHKNFTHDERKNKQSEALKSTDYRAVQVI